MCIRAGNRGNYWHSCCLVLQLFYQLRGDMVLKVIENGRRREVLIREGEVGSPSWRWQCAIPVIQNSALSCIIYVFMIVMSLRIFCVGWGGGSSDVSASCTDPPFPPERGQHGGSCSGTEEASFWDRLPEVLLWAFEETIVAHSKHTSLINYLGWVLPLSLLSVFQILCG